jgi:protein TonB
MEAKQKGYQGKVLLKVEVLPNGRVGEIEVKESSGYEVLDRSALETVKKWRFIPATKGGVSIPSWVHIPITFQLQDVSF